MPDELQALQNAYNEVGLALLIIIASIAVFGPIAIMASKCPKPATKEELEDYAQKLEWHDRHGTNMALFPPLMAMVRLHELAGVELPSKLAEKLRRRHSSQAHCAMEGPEVARLLQLALERHSPRQAA